jgi:glycosyltransferase involved in cell wall biosynthesis
MFPANGDFVERHALAVSEICTTAVIHVLSDENIKGSQTYEVFEKDNQSLHEILIYFKRSHSIIKPLARMINLCRYGKGYLKGYRILKAKSGKPDLIHANIIFPVSIMAWLWRMFSGIPYIISEHWTLYLTDNIHHLPFIRLTRRAVKKASVVAPVTKNLEMALQRHGYKGNYEIVPNVVDTAKFTPGLRNPESGKVRLLHVSSMKEEQKNISGILRVIERLSLLRNDFIITFIGDVQDSQKKLADELGLTDDILVFKGELSHDEVAVSMHQSDVLVMFSNIENLPCVILEALSCGLPVISSDVGGIREWVNESCGVLVHPANEVELLNALNYMLDHHPQYNREDLHQYAVENFSKKAIAEKFCSIYKRVLNSLSDD